MITRTSALSASEVERNVHHLFLGVAQGRRSATAPESVDRFLGTRHIRAFHDAWVVEVVASQNELDTAILEGASQWASVFASATAPELEAPERDANHAILERALRTPHVETPVAHVPEPMGNLVRDVRAVTNLTNHDLAEILGVKERTVFNIQSGRSGKSYDAVLNSLLAIGRILVPGLGPGGVRKWLTVGSPPRLDRIRAGEIEEIHEEARAYLR